MSDHPSPAEAGSAKTGRRKLIEKVRALLQKTVENGCTEGEAMAAAANSDSAWRSLNDVGDTFVDTICEGEGDPWDGPLAVPGEFTERALHARTSQTPTVLVDVRGGNVEQVTACGDVRVMVLDHDNLSFTEDAVDDRVDAAMMERLIHCSRDLVEAHERGLGS